MAKQHGSAHPDKQSQDETRLSLCMIVRDNEDTLPACLESIRPWVDEMVVVDTGSRDRTPRIAKGFGARLLKFAWCDDFAAARNESLKHAKGRWLFWMDSDDTMPPECGRKLWELANKEHTPHTLGFVMQVHCPGPAPNGDCTVVDHVKMFRNHSELRFEFRIHEQIIPAIRRLGGTIDWTDIFVVHSGAGQSPSGKRRKYERDMRILRAELSEKPDHPFVLFNLGMTYADMQEYQSAVEILRLCLDYSDAGESHVRKAYALLVNSLDQIGRTDEALRVCQEGRRHYSRDPELLFRQALLFHKLGKLTEAVDSYRGAIADSDVPHFASIDPGITTYKARHNLALVYSDHARDDLAEHQWRLALDGVPQFQPAWRALGDALVRQRKLTAAELLSTQMMDVAALRSTGWILKAETAAARDQFDEARHQFDEAQSEYPDDIDVLRARSRFLFEHGTLEEAKQALAELALRIPEDGAVHHNLGIVCMRLESYSKAAESFRESLRSRPNHVDSHRLLDEVLLLQSKTKSQTRGPSSISHG